MFFSIRWLWLNLNSSAQGVLAGIIVGGVVVLALIIAVTVIIIRSVKRRAEFRKVDTQMRAIQPSAAVNL